MNEQIKQTFDFYWDQIEVNFNWTKVFKAMKSLDWSWYMSDENYGIPTLETIKKHARKLLYEVWERGAGMSSTGGLIAGWDHGEMYLVFQLEEWVSNTDY